MMGTDTDTLILEQCTANPPLPPYMHAQLSLAMLWTSRGAALCSMTIPLGSRSSGAVKRAVSCTPADLGTALHGCWFCASVLCHSTGGSSTAGTEVAPVPCHRAAGHVAPLPIAAPNRDFHLFLSINLLPISLHWRPSELSAKPPGLSWSVSALSHPSL